MLRREDIPLEGELNCWTRGFDLPDLLLAVCDTRKTGLLRFVSSEAEKTLFLRRGEIIFAKSSSVDDRLGEYLLRRGQLTLRNFSNMTQLVQPGTRLGALLVENGILSPKELVQAVIGQVRAIVLSLFRWTEAWYGFTPQELPSKETITLDMPAARLILDGVQLIDSWRRIVQGVGEVSCFYRRVEGNEKLLRRLDLDTPTLEILAILSRPMSIEEACEASSLPDIDVCRRLWVFRCLKWVEQVSRADQVTSIPVKESGEKQESPPIEGMAPSEGMPPVEGTPVTASLADLVETSRTAKAPRPRAGMPPPAAELPPAAVGSPAPAGEVPESHLPDSQQVKAAKKRAVLETVDLDIEGLGMVFGEEDSK